MWGDGEQVREIGREAARLSDDVRRQADSLSRCLGVQWESPAAERLREVLTGHVRSLRERADDLAGATRLLELHAEAVDDRLATLDRLRALA